MFHCQTSGCRIHHGAHAETWFLFIRGASLTLALATQRLWGVLQLQLCSRGWTATLYCLSIPIAFVTATIHSDAWRRRGRGEDRQKARGSQEQDQSRVQFPWLRTFFGRVKRLKTALLTRTSRSESDERNTMACRRSRLNLRKSI